MSQPRGPGRPKHPARSRRVILSVRVSPGLPGTLRGLARRAGQPLGEWVEARLQSAVPRRHSQRDRHEQAQDGHSEGAET